MHCELIFEREGARGRGEGTAARGLVEVRASRLLAVEKSLCKRHFAGSGPRGMLQIRHARVEQSRNNETACMIVARDLRCPMRKVYRSVPTADEETQKRLALAEHNHRGKRGIDMPRQSVRHVNCDGCECLKNQTEKI